MKTLGTMGILGRNVLELRLTADCHVTHLCLASAAKLDLPMKLIEIASDYLPDGL